MSQAAIERPERGFSATPPELTSSPSSHGTLDPPSAMLRRSMWRTAVGMIIAQLPTLSVLALLAGVGFYGHTSGWKLPSFSTIAGAKEPGRGDWCEDHGVPDSKCVECHPELLPGVPDHGWCSEHGVQNCPLHHPEVAQLKESPTILPADLKRAARALKLADRKQSNAACQMYRKRIQFASVEAVRQAGVDVELVERRSITETVTGNGEIRYDPTRLATLSSRVPGTVWQVEKTIGDRVRRGEILALVDAMEAGQAKTRLMQSLAEAKLQRQNVSRLRSAAGAVAERQILEAEAALAKAEAAVMSADQSLINLGLPAVADQLRDLTEREVLLRLRFLGLPPVVREQLGDQTMTANLIPVLSPMDGVIVERTVTEGEVVDGRRELFQVADTSRMWLILNIPLENAGKLAAGQRVRFRPDGYTQEVSGTIDWISTAADRETRMLQVRAGLSNPDGRLRDETFGTGKVVLREETEAIVVDDDAVHWEGCCQIVFVRDAGYFDSPSSPKVFHVRTVRTGAASGDFTEILAGVLPGEVVATTGSDVLRAQLLKNNLGAGCCAE